MEIHSFLTNITAAIRLDDLCLESCYSDSVDFEYLWEHEHYSADMWTAELIQESCFAKNIAM